MINDGDNGITMVTSKPALGDPGDPGAAVQVEFGKFQKDEQNRANRDLEPTEMEEVVDRTDRQDRVFANRDVEFTIRWNWMVQDWVADGVELGRLRLIGVL